MIKDETQRSSCDLLSGKIIRKSETHSPIMHLCQKEVPWRNSIELEQMDGIGSPL